MSQHVTMSPEEAAEHFGWMARFVAIDGPASNKRTREQLDWQPKEVGLVADLDKGTYFDEYQRAARTARATRRGRGPLLIQENTLVVQRSGHQRSFVGRAYDPQLLPNGVSAEAVQ